MRETQEGFPSPFKSVVFETFSKFQKFRQRGEKNFRHAAQNHWFWRRSFLPFFRWRKKGSRRRHFRAQGVRHRDVSPSHGFAVPALFRQGAVGTGDADCHDQFANWSRNDMAFYRGCRARPVREDRGVRPYGGVTRDAGKESPSHGFAVPAPFRQGAIKDGGCGLPHQWHRSLVRDDRDFCKEDEGRGMRIATGAERPRNDSFLWCDVCFFDGFRVYNFRAPCPY